MEKNVRFLKFLNLNSEKNSLRTFGIFPAFKITFAYKLQQVRQYKYLKESSNDSSFVSLRGNISHN